MDINEEKREFYNNDNKQAWLSIVDENMVSLANPVFASSAVFEESYDTDLCNFSKDRIISFFSSLLSISTDRLMNIVSMLKAYTDWCIVNDLVLDGQNHYLEIKYDDLYDCINKTALSFSYITRKDLLNWSHGYAIEDAPFNPCDLAVIWLLFEGVRGPHYSEILNVEVGDIDVVNHEVRLSTGRKLKISKTCASYAAGIIRNKTYVLPTLREWPFLDDRILRSFRKDQLDRESKNADHMVTRLNKRVVKTLELFGVKNASLKSVIVSGQIDYIKYEAKRRNMDIYSYITSPDCYNMIYRRYGIKTWYGNRFYQLHREMLLAE